MRTAADCESRIEWTPAERDGGPEEGLAPRSGDNGGRNRGARPLAAGLCLGLLAGTRSAQALQFGGGIVGPRRADCLQPKGPDHVASSPANTSLPASADLSRHLAGARGRDLASPAGTRTAAWGRAIWGLLSGWTQPGDAACPSASANGAAKAEPRRLGRRLRADDGDVAAQGIYVNPLCLDLPDIAGGMYVMKRHGILEFCNVDGLRAVDVVRMLEVLDRAHPELPEFDPTLVCTRNAIEECVMAMPNQTMPVPAAMAFSRRLSAGGLAGGAPAILVPDRVFWAWEEVGIDDFEATAARIRAAGRRPPARLVAGWIGNPRTSELRERLLSLSEANPDLLEATGMDWRLPRRGGHHLACVPACLSLPEQVAAWAYLVDIVGHNYSFRTKLLLHSDRPVLFQAREHEEYYHHLLSPFVHYVPVNKTLDDLLDKITWLRENIEEGANIARNARDFARLHLTRRAAQARWLEAFWEVIEIQRRGQRAEAKA